MARLLWPLIIVLLILTDDSVKTQDIEADSFGCQESNETSTLEDVCSKIRFNKNYRYLTIIPQARLDYESITREAKGQMGY